MKRYVPIIIGIVALCAVLYAGNRIIKNRDMAKEETTTTMEGTQPVSGKVTRMFEGENTLEYSFDIPEDATTSLDKDGALVKIDTPAGPLTQVYFSYEGARGYSPEDYIKNLIVPNVAVLTMDGTSTLGNYDWAVAESEWSSWHVTRAQTGNWLIIVENRKVDADKANAIIESMSAK